MKFCMMLLSETKSSTFKGADINIDYLLLNFMIPGTVELDGCQRICLVYLPTVGEFLLLFSLACLF